jgi:hypothetical protein
MSAASAFHQLDALLGEWVWEASIAGVPTAHGEASFEWLEGDGFLVQRADGEPAPTAPPEWTVNSPFPTAAVIAFDDVTGMFSYAYADARGVRRVYEMKLTGGCWEISGQAGPEFYQRFRGTFSTDEQSIAGRWERSGDNSNWEIDFDITYTKVVLSDGY